MKLAALLLAAPAVLQLVAADPRPNELHARALERWVFERQGTTGGASASPTQGNSETEKETTPPASPTASPTSTTPAPTPTTTPTSTRDEETSSARPTSDASPTQSPTQAQPTSTSSPSSQAQASNTPTQNAPTSRTTAPVVLSTPPPSTSQFLTTNEQGAVFTSVLLITRPASAISSPSTTSDDTTSKPISKGTIIGLAVTGSIAVLIVILLIVWKLTNKRFSDLEDTGDDAIKWPELNKDSAAMTPLPTRPTARSGADTSTLDKFDTQSAAQSTAELYQPYSDDPGYGARPQYYDPYGGAPGSTRPYASPPGSHDGDHKNWGVPAEGQGYADPHQQQYYDAPMRGPSPGPNMAYGDSIGRGTSPGPNMAYADPAARAASPGPAGYGGYPAKTTTP
ncbi:hypothetical protein FRC07_000951 [Ceratobasidium sp. 392]|nr:hypothetical protein FRC07_000951 [Ceratobasidium sp. 392]